MTTAAKHEEDTDTGQDGETLELVTRSRNSDTSHETSLSYAPRDVAAALLSFYRLLIRASIPEDRLLVPDETGWSQINEQTLAPLGKTQNVIELLKHLPYIKHDTGDDQGPLLWTDCVCIDYRSSFVQERLATSGNFTEAQDWLVGKLKPHEVVIAQAQTKLGGCDLMFNALDGQAVKRDRRGYRSFPSMMDLVSDLTLEVTSLEILPIDQHRVLTPPAASLLQESLRATWHRHGWPGESYCKSACLAEIMKMQQEHAEYMETRGTELDPYWGLDSEERKVREEEDQRREDEADAIEEANSQKELPYSIEHVSQQLLSLYEFLVDLYIPEEQLLRPPKDGWPYVTMDDFAWTNKHERVVQLLKHLPYIVGDNYACQIWDRCRCNDFCEGSIPPWDALGEFDGSEGPLVGHLLPTQVALAEGAGREGFCFVFDTLTGAITRYAPQYVELPIDESIDGLESTEHWVFNNIDAFVERTKQEFRSLTVAPIDEWQVRKLDEYHGPERAEQFRSFYRRHGWATAAWNKGVLKTLSSFRDELDQSST